MYEHYETDPYLKLPYYLVYFKLDELEEIIENAIEKLPYYLVYFKLWNYWQELTGYYIHFHTI